MVRKVSFKTLILSLLFALPMLSFASGSSNGKGLLAERGSEEKKSAISEFIRHHLKDSHDFHLFSNAETGDHFSFPLPVILWTENGLVTFMSSSFHHDDEGKVLVKKNGANFTKIHGKIYQLDAGQKTVSFDEHHHAKNASVITLDLSITKNVTTILLVALLMLFMFSKLAKGYKNGPIPTGFGRVLEPLVLYVRDEIARPNIGEKKYKKFMGYLLTVFFFIWILNLLGLTPLGVNVTGNIAITMCLAIFTFIITQINGNKDYWGHIFWMPGVPVLMKIILAPIEVLGMFTKPFALMLRLFANITAGHVVVMSLLGLIFWYKTAFGGLAISIPLTLFISVIELLVAFLQAYIFTMLSSLFIGMAVEEHDHH